MKRFWLGAIVACFSMSLLLGAVAAQDDKDAKEKQPEKPMEKKFLDRTIAEWIKILKSDEKADRRAGSVKVLFAAGVAETTALPEILEAAEKDKDTQVRVEAVKIIGRFDPKKTRSAVPALVNALQNDKDGAVREVAATALGDGYRVGTNESKFTSQAGDYVTDIAASLKDSHVGTRIAVATTLRNMDELAAPAVPMLIIAARDPKEHLLVRVAAVHVVSRHGKKVEESLPMLIAVAKSTDNPLTLREHALDGIGRAGSDAADVMKTFEQTLNEKSVELRRATAVALGSLGPKAKGVWPGIKAHLADQKEDTSVRNHLIRLSGVLGKSSSEAIDALMTAATKDESTENRIAAIQELGGLGPLAKSAEKTLEFIAVQDARAAVRDAATKAVKNIRAQ